MLTLAQIPLVLGPLMGLSASVALTWIGIAVISTLFAALAAATASGRPAGGRPPPPDPQSCITTLAGSIDQVRAELPPGDYRSWSEHGPPVGRR